MGYCGYGWMDDDFSSRQLKNNMWLVFEYIPGNLVRIRGLGRKWWWRDEYFKIESPKLSRAHWGDDIITIGRRFGNIAIQKRSDLMLYGNVIGPGIMNNQYDIGDKKVYFYLINNYSKKEHFSVSDSILTFHKMEVNMFPYLVSETSELNRILSEEVDFNTARKRIKKLAVGPSKVNPNVPRAGLFVRSLSDSTKSFSITTGL